MMRQNDSLSLSCPPLFCPGSFCHVLIWWWPEDALVMIAGILRAMTWLQARMGYA
jgi:hypothetical protein